MRHRIGTITRTLGMRARGVAAALLQPAFPGWSLGRVEDWIGSLPPRHRRLLVGGALGMLFIMALIAAQFGVVGLGIYFLGVMLLVR
ncbi:MAG: hypothetical protein ACK4GO_07415 [Gemmobacter sp.]